MRIQVEKFLALTALLAAGSVMSAGCVTEDTQTDTDAGVSGGGGAGGSTGGSGGSTGGSGGVAGGGGAAGGGGVAGGGGAAGADGGGGTAGADGGDAAACLGDTGTKIADCTKLSYATTTCGDGGTLKPLGLELCDWVKDKGRLGLQQPMWDCLNAITSAKACDDATAQKCYDDLAPKACEQGPIPDGDGGTYDVCKSVAASCTGAKSVTEAACDAVIDPTSPSAADAIWTCYEAGSGDCDADFYACVGLP